MALYTRQTWLRAEEAPSLCVVQQEVPERGVPGGDPTFRPHSLGEPTDSAA